MRQCQFFPVMYFKNDIVCGCQSLPRSAEGFSAVTFYVDLQQIYLADFPIR